MRQSATQAFAAAWRELGRKEGVVWRRPPTSPFHYVADALRPVLGQLPPHISVHEFTNRCDVEEGIRSLVQNSPISAHLTPDQSAILQSELHGMYYMATGMSNCLRCYIDIRIEHKHAIIERYHQDLGTVLLTTLAGPGTHFITHDNMPSRRESSFFREDLRRPEEVYEVPERDVLFMHGIPASGRAPQRGEPNGLWHSSPPKRWHAETQWDSRILIVVTTPESKIVPLPTGLSAAW